MRLDRSFGSASACLASLTMGASIRIRRHGCRHGRCCTGSSKPRHARANARRRCDRRCWSWSPAPRRSQQGLRDGGAQRDPTPSIRSRDPFQPGRDHAMVGLVVTADRQGRAVTMPVRNDPRTGGWYFRITVKPPGGKKQRLFGTPGIPGPYQDLAPNEKGAIAAEQRAIAQAFADAAKATLPAPPEKEEVPTFGDWFNGRFWREWVVAQKNKPTEVRSKAVSYTHLRAHETPEHL